MSSLVVEVTTISKVREHSNADKLEIAEIKGWQVCVGKGVFHEGDRVVYFPPDTVLPRLVSDTLCVTPYLGKVWGGAKHQLVGRIRQVRLRGEPSFGLAVPVLSEEWEVGDDVAACYGATKYEPPMRIDAGDTESSHPLFERYTDIENLRNYLDVFEEGEEVVITEKIHGTNCRVGFVPYDDGSQGRLIAGSHGMQRKFPGHGNDIAGHLYWHVAQLPGTLKLLTHFSAQGYKQIILFGETYGARVQKGFDYGLKDSLGFRAFDLYLDGKYVGTEEKDRLFTEFSIPHVPTLYRGPYSLEMVKEFCAGQTTLSDAVHMLEGVVITPVVERRDPKVGRVILKYVSDEYLLAKHPDVKDE